MERTEFVELKGGSDRLTASGKKFDRQTDLESGDLPEGEYTVCIYESDMRYHKLISSDYKLIGSEVVTAENALDAAKKIWRSAVGGHYKITRNIK